MKKSIFLILLVTISLIGCVKRSYKCTCVKYKLYWDGGIDTVRVSTSITTGKCDCNRNDTLIIDIGDIITNCK